MRKYWRLILIIIAASSCGLMLLYRQKYYNLNSVVELMNIFSGRAENKSKCHETSNDSVSHHFSHLRSMVEEQIINSNHWTEIFHGIHSYSSHFLSGKVIALGYGNEITARDLESISCKLWYENRTESVASTLKISILNINDVSFLFYMTCSSTNDLGVPHAVTFMYRNISSTLPVFYKQVYIGPYTACVKPLSPTFHDVYKILEFIIYHSHIGINHFVFYYTSLSTIVRKLLINVAADCGVFVELLPWNTPYGFETNKLKLKPFIIDCLFHVSALNHSNYLFVLNLNNFIYFNEASDLKKITSDVKSPYDFVQFEKHFFCSEFSDNIIAQNLNIQFKTLLKTKVHKQKSQKANVIYNVKQMKLIMKQPGGLKKWLFTRKMQNMYEVKTSLGIVFSYTECGADSVNEVSASLYTENSKMWEFKNAFFKSCIFFQAKNGSLINN